MDLTFRQNLAPEPLILGKDGNSIDLSRYNIGPKLASVVLQAATTLKAYDKINLAHNDMSQESLSEVVDVLVSPHSADTKELNLSGNLIFGKRGEVPEFSSKLVEYIASTTHLRSLVLAECLIGNGEIEELVKGLERNRSIVNLDLSRNSIDGRGADALGRMLESPIMIEKLNLAWNRIGRFGGIHGAERICDAITVTNALSWLDLSCNHLDDTCAKHLSSSLATDTTLKYLNIANNSIGSKGARQISLGLSLNKTLRFLVMDGNPVRLAGGIAIRRVLRDRDTDLPSLKLSLEHCLFDTSVRISFDPKDPNGTYTLDLSDPKEEKIALHLLNMASSLDDCDVYRPLTHVQNKMPTARSVICLR